MTAITADMIKQLRESTGAGMLDCRKALTETAGVMDDAVDWLRKKGLSAAAKKSGRVAAEGVVAAIVNGLTGAVIELNAETDFVSRNEQFQQLASEIVKLAPAAAGDVEKLKAAAYPGTGRTSNTGRGSSALLS
jgi:elongation factor Ts